MKSRICAGVLLLSLTGAFPLRAVQMEPLSVEQLADQSALVVRGTVLSESCQRDPAGRIYTKVELQVGEVWKGSLPTNRCTIVHGGGILGGEKSVVSGQVDYGIGEEVVAFLVLNQRGEGVTLGLAQGKFHVWQEQGTGERLVRNLFHGAPDNLRGAVPRGVKPRTAQRLTLTELKQRVHRGNR
jgi:hypothetical protein